MLRKRFIIFILIICVLFTSTGCWDSVDINDKSLVTLVVTDRESEEAVFHVEIPNLALGQSQEGGGGGGGTKEKTQIITGRGKTYADARRDLNAKLQQPLYLGAVRTLVVTQELAKHGIEEYMFRLQNTLDYRKTLEVVITNEIPDDLLSTTPLNTEYQGFYIEQIITDAKKSGKIVAYSGSEVIEFIYSHYCFVLPNVGLIEDSIAFTGFSVIHKGKYLDFIPSEEARGLVWLLGDNVQRIYDVPFGDHSATVEVMLKKRAVKPTYSDDKITFDIAFYVASQVRYLNSDIQFDESARSQVKTNLQGLILKDISDAIEQSKSLKCDYLGFKEKFRVMYPNEVKTMDWEPKYVDSMMNISVDSTLDIGGMMDFDAQTAE